MRYFLKEDFAGIQCLVTTEHSAPTDTGNRDFRETAGGGVAQAALSEAVNLKDALWNLAQGLSEGAAKALAATTLSKVDLEVGLELSQTLWVIGPAGKGTIKATLSWTRTPPAVQ